MHIVPLQTTKNTIKHCKDEIRWDPSEVQRSCRKPPYLHPPPLPVSVSFIKLEAPRHQNSPVLLISLSLNSIDPFSYELPLIWSVRMILPHEMNTVKYDKPHKSYSSILPCGQTQSDCQWCVSGTEASNRLPSEAAPITVTAPKGAEKPETSRPVFTKMTVKTVTLFQTSRSIKRPTIFSYNWQLEHFMAAAGSTHESIKYVLIQFWKLSPKKCQFHWVYLKLLETTFKGVRKC